MRIGKARRKRGGNDQRDAVALHGMPSYFAYGSNMSQARMAQRVIGSVSLGRGRLRQYGFRCDKVGRDGSGKANVVAAVGEIVWGVVYDMDDRALYDLDRFEGGYQRCVLPVVLDGGDCVECHVYVSSKTSAGLLPLTSYRDVMARGAREHGLPDRVVEALENLPTLD